MTHHHDHDHDHDHTHHHHDHDHDHGHHHHHHHTESTLSFEEKLQTLLTHWINHNNDHAKNYGDWAAKTAHAGRDDVAALLKEASDKTNDISAAFQKALDLIEKK